MTNEEFNEYYPKYAGVIRAIARKIAQQNSAIYDELEQAGCIGLWRCDPSRATDNPDAYIRQAIKFRMIDTMRQLNPKRWRSLTQALDNGAQVIRDEDTGELILIEARPQTRPDVDGEDACGRAGLRSAIPSLEDGYGLLPEEQDS